MDPSLKNKLRPGRQPLVDRPQPAVQKKQPPADTRAAEIAEHELPPDLDAALVAQYERFASAFEFLDKRADEIASTRSATSVGEAETAAAKTTPRASTSPRALAEKADLRSDESIDELPEVTLLSATQTDWLRVERATAADRTRLDVDISPSEWLATLGDHERVIGPWLNPDLAWEAERFKSTTGTSVQAFTAKAEKQTLLEIARFPTAVTQAAKKTAEALVGDVPSPKPAAVLFNRWRAYLATAGAHGIEGNIYLVIQGALRESYASTNIDLKFRADKVRHHNLQKKLIRGYLEKEREFLAQQLTDAGAQGLDPNIEPYSYGMWTKEHPYIDGVYMPNEGAARNYHAAKNSEMREWSRQYAAEHRTPYHVDEEHLQAWKELGLDSEIPPADKYTRADIEKHLELTENELSAVGDDAQLANVDLQAALQKQQQTMQLLSNSSKMLHDTAMAITRKMGS